MVSLYFTPILLIYLTSSTDFFITVYFVVYCGHKGMIYLISFFYMSSFTRPFVFLNFYMRQFEISSLKENIRIDFGLVLYRYFKIIRYIIDNQSFAILMDVINYFFIASFQKTFYSFAMALKKKITFFPIT